MALLNGFGLAVLSGCQLVLQISDLRKLLLLETLKTGIQCILRRSIDEL
jgi:hypothetical protein